VVARGLLNEAYSLQIGRKFLITVEEIHMMKVAKKPSTLLSMLIVGIGAVGFTAGASAVDLGVGANVGVQTPSVGVQTQGNAGTSAGSADVRTNTQEKLNSNDRKLPDAKRGLERSQDRMSEAGTEHEQATTVHTKTKTHVAKKKKAATY
jgi:hypothetical protein